MGDKWSEFSCEDYQDMARKQLRCWKCGDLINIRIIGKIARPLHLTPGKKCPAAGKWKPISDQQLNLFEDPVIYTPALQSFTKDGKCSCRRDHLSSVSHRYGRLLFDRLDSPWKRHVCEQQYSIDYGLDFLASRLQLQKIVAQLTLIAGVWLTKSPNPRLQVALVEVAPPHRWRWPSLEFGKMSPTKLPERIPLNPGGFVGVTLENDNAMRVFTTEHVEMISSECSSPKDFGLPEDWC